MALFCKNSLDEQLMEDILGIHIAGRTIRFYVLVLPATATYVLTRRDQGTGLDSGLVWLYHRAAIHSQVSACLRYNLRMF